MHERDPFKEPVRVPPGNLSEARRIWEGEATAADPQDPGAIHVSGYGRCGLRLTKDQWIELFSESLAH